MTSNLPQTEEKTKTVRVDGYVTCVAAGHSCCRGMAWESPYIQVELTGGMNKTEYLWHSDQVIEILHRHGIKHGRQMIGKDFGVSMLVRGNRVWRITHIYAVET
jgi:hypothetical protein